MATVNLSWDKALGAVAYNIYYDTSPGLSVKFTTLLDNTTELTYAHTVSAPAVNRYYIVVGVGPNGELSPPSEEINVVA